ncbi:bifunctional phosphoribosylaminoimidazolecarboxamide formyltransferase/IMP cyclohydrolase [Gemella sp. GH3]|uniref:bifunctional phosphoribosylaminoimidazolecarboxamide formyltransferase/IMP cyclohydrolase n=1 Tax=unclassified Gemella TaxID=2624949 RepID=UPI0015CFBF54|nr:MULTISPECIES: bifunctional phosphoribosylaminoimidazolecarboxamide formyltransferase/IMP cyclohydrolase [unclassified Gemella]MBF0713771.1 bifunctional phosphoribosylaminoimidazolecarboxamide formyltransferase/IMP cyclohydrolase [Gemella sp. GH3.1]NYS50723.1 bifunctional phosphoribosylaminoimidazolecarboxamide formyltransferase/IMP cyclohydrolase [Gemella sp. GH3]
MKKRALISVSDKTDIIEFAKGLENQNFEIISTGGTFNYLKNNGVNCISIEDITNFPEILEGRVKTLHPKIHGGLLSKRKNELHNKHIKDNNIDYIDLVCVNLYPFEETIKKDNVSEEEIIENIDIGGPSMLRSAAKNFNDVVVVTDIKDYSLILDELSNGEITLATRRKLAIKAFSTTASYDAAISNYFNKKDNLIPEKLTLSYKLENTLRYGENPHQKAYHYVSDNNESYAIQNAVKLHGKDMSYNNIQDASAALDILSEFDETVCVAVKHTNPCGVAIGNDVFDAYTRAYEADPVSIFGGIVAINGKIDKKTAEKMNSIFLEIILANDYDDDALQILTQKKNLRIYKLGKKNKNKEIQIKSVRGGILVQDFNDKLTNNYVTVTDKKATDEEIEDLEFGLKIVKHVKSNAIVVVKNKQTLGIGAGQMNRVGSCKIALEQAGDKAKGAVLASDAFFPMRDSVDLAAKYKISAIVQPGGSIRDEESINACNEKGVAMMFSEIRHFKH